MKKDIFNFELLSNLILTKEFNMPIIEGTLHIPKNLISFNYALSTKERFNKGIHFYIDDYQFERVWQNPKKYLNLLKQFDCVIAPDFSVYKNFPLPLQLYNIYKSRLLSAYWQKRGLIVIPNITWSNKESLLFCLDGIPKYSVVALSTNGCLNKETKQEFLDCFHKAMEMLQPTKILIIGEIPKELENNNKIIKFNSHLEHLHKLNKGGKL